MFLNYLVIALRTLTRNKIPFIINLTGMSIALGCCIAAWVNYEFNNEFDQLQQNAPNIYRVGFHHNSDGKHVPYGVTPMPVGNLIKENIKEIDEVVRYISRDGAFRIGTEMFQSQVVYADENFSKVFTIPLRDGTFDLSQQTGVMISDKLAEKYYGKTDPVGQPLTQIISGKPREYVVTGVFEAFPYNSSFRFDIITHFDNYFVDATEKQTLENDWKRWTTVFLYVKNSHAITRITKQLEQYKKPQNEARPDLKAENFYVESFIGIGPRAVKERNMGHWLNQPMPPAAVIAPFAMAGFLLLIACFNFTNNSIAIAGKRLKEIGIRKVIGGRKKELIIQFLSESFVFCVLSFLVALVLGEYFVAGWDAMWPGIELEVRYENNYPFLAALGILILFTTFLAGGYPAFYISAFKPIQVLKGTTKFGGTNWLTKSLLVLQFSISLAGVIFAIAFYANSKFQKSYDLGYTYQSVVQVPVENEQQYIQLRDALQTNPLIHSVGGTTQHIYSSSYKAKARTEKVEETEVDMLNVGEDYFKTLNVRVLRGREFERDRASDFQDAIVVNEEFARTFKLGDDPVGKRVMVNDTVQYFVIGVVKDVYLSALFQPLSSVAFRYVPSAQFRFLVASTTPENLLAVNQQVGSEWKKLFPNNLYTGRLMEERMVMAMEHFDNVVILYTFLGAVAIIMSVSGLFSLVTLNLQQRTKELGIRKILGAPLINIIMRASKLFIIVMLISFAIGGFAGAFMVNGLMDTVWEYYVPIDYKIILTSIVILFVISAVTVGLRIFSVSTTNPVESLRYE